jgi:hypothetical protein
MTISFVVLILVLNPESPTGFPGVLVREGPGEQLFHIRKNVSRALNPEGMTKVVADTIRQKLKFECGKVLLLGDYVGSGLIHAPALTTISHRCPSLPSGMHMKQWNEWIRDLSSARPLERDTTLLVLHRAGLLPDNFPICSLSRLCDS